MGNETPHGEVSYNHLGDIDCWHQGTGNGSVPVVKPQSHTAFCYRPVSGHACLLRRLALAPQILTALQGRVDKVLAEQFAQPRATA